MRWPEFCRRGLRKNPETPARPTTPGGFPEPLHRTRPPMSLSHSVLPVVMAGGSGTRLWPLSRAGYPKQFLPLVADGTMIQETVARVGEADGFAPPVFICADDHRFVVAEQMRQIGVAPSAIILEPVARNTAPAV